MMFDDDDDDGVEPQFNAVDEYYFEVTKDELVCFSILPFQFDENDEVGDWDSEKKVYLCGVMDKIPCLVHKQVVAWRVGLDCEQPNISVCSTEGKWIKLLNPWKCYKHELARSILITVQMLHFVRRQHRYKRNLRDRLWDHLNEVFIKFDTKPAIDDLRKHHPLIKLFLERDQAFMKLKILHRFIGDITKTMEEPRASGTKVQFTGSDEPRERNNGTDSEYDDDDDDDVNDDSDYDEDIISDGDTNNDDGADTLCALCDDGGNLLSCIGQCKRSFHPRKEDGKESKCKTLGYTSAQLKEIDSYLCKNCEYKQHQCFKCGELEPSAEPNAKIADKLHSQMQAGDMDNLMDDSHVDKDAELENEICRTPEDKDGDGKEKSSEHSVEAEDATNKDTSHENNERNDVLGQINVDIHAEVDQSKCKSRAERSMELRENADGHDSISGQEISIGENQMCQGMCEQESRSGKGKITRNKSAKSGSGNGVTPNHVDDNPREKLLHVPHVDKMTNTNGLHPQPEYGCDKDQEVNGGHAFQEESNSSRCNVNPEAMGIHTLGDKSRKRRELEKKSADDNSTDLDKKKRCNHVQDGKKAHCDHSSRQCHSLHKVLDYEDRKFGNNGLGSRCYDENGAAEISEYKCGQSTGPSSSQCNVDPETMGMHTSCDMSRKRKNLKKQAADGNNTDLDNKKRCNHIEVRKVAHGAAEVSEYKSRQCTGSTRRENMARSRRENSSNSPMGRNFQEKPRNHLSNRQSSYCDRYATNRHRYEQYHDDSYLSSGDYGSRSHVPLCPVSASTDFDARYDPHSYPRGPEHDITGWDRPQLYPGRAGYFTGGWQSPPYCPARPERAYYSRNANSFPIDGYDEHGNFMHSAYRAMGFTPAAMNPPLQGSNNGTYQPRTDVDMEGCGEAYCGNNREYGARSTYTFCSGPLRPAAGSVMDRYAPNLEQTNHRARG